MVKHDASSVNMSAIRDEYLSSENEDFAGILIPQDDESSDDPYAKCENILFPNNVNNKSISMSQQVIPNKSNRLFAHRDLKPERIETP